MQRAAEQYDGAKFSINNLIEAERGNDKKDLEELLKATCVEKPKSHLIMKDLVRLCTQFNINIDLPGNTAYDPTKADETDKVKDQFI